MGQKVLATPVLFGTALEQLTNKMLKNLIFLCLIATISCAVKLPSYFKKCKFNDASLVQCVKDNIPIALPHLKDGIKELNIPSFNPLHVKEINIHATKELQIKLYNVDLYNLTHFEIKDFQLDTEKNHIKVQLFFKKIILLSDYEINGKILMFAIQGHGPSNFTLDDILVDVEFSLIPFERKGEQFVGMSNQKFQYQYGSAYIKLDNLFNGDKNLGDQMNQFLNENFNEIREIINPGLTEALLLIIHMFFDKVANTIPINELFEV